MARPRSDASGPSAKERMREAFWGLLAENPSAPLSVRELCARAHVHKNAFYYHYSGIADLIREAIDGIINPERFQRLLGIVQGAIDSEGVPPEDLDALRKLSLIAGAHGTPALRSLLRSALSDAWDERLGTSVATMSVPQRLDREFLLGGILGVLACIWECGCAEGIDAARDAKYPIVILQVIDQGM